MAREIIDIRFSGMTEDTSDYTCPDGELSLGVNLLNENGTLGPVNKPTDLGFGPGAGAKVFIHKGSTYVHYICGVQDGDNIVLTYYDATDGLTADSSCQYILNDSEADSTVSGETLVGFAAVGHILMVSTDSHVYYFRWKVQDGEYVYLGTEVPAVDMEFALNLELTEKVYTKLGINVEYNDTSSSTSDAWKALASTAFKETSSNSQKFNLSGVELANQTEYKLSTNYNLAALIDEIFLYGTNIDTGEEDVKIKTWYVSGNYKKFVCDGNYKDLYFTVILRGKNYPASGTLTISEGLAYSGSGYSVEYTEENYTAVMGIMNKFVANVATNKNKFVYPFFIRYAVKMYDGTYTRISDPILMIPNSGYAPLLYHVANTKSDADIYAYAFVGELLYRLNSSVGEDWEDLIQSVCIFASEPIYPYDQSQEYDEGEDLFVYEGFTYDDDGNVDLNPFDEFGIGTLHVGSTDLSETYKKQYLYDYIYSQYSFGHTSEASNWYALRIAARDDDTITKDLTTKSNFYLLKEIALKDLVSVEDDSSDTVAGFVALNMEDGVLSTLVTREALDENALSNVSLLGGGVYTFNSRLHVYGTSLSLPTPTLPYKEFNKTTTPGLDVYKIHVWVKTDEGEKTVVRSYGHQEGFGYGQPWYFYPDSRAYKIEFVNTQSNLAIALPLTTHDYLNGAYYYTGDIGVGINDTTDIYTDPTEVGDDYSESIDKSGVIYVSEVSNPFVFESGNTISVGSAKVIALATAAQALSEGQFGSFPLYAFTDEGVWSIALTDTGTYESRQPITRDVALSEECVTPIDSSVLFATKRGIMEIAGSKSACISDNLVSDEDEAEKIDNLPYVASLYTLAGLSDEETAAVLARFLTFIEGCQMLYDYVHQRIVVYNPSYSYAYVYSIKSGLWGMMSASISSKVINAYPDCLAIDGDGHFVDMSDDSDGYDKGLFVTRPMKLGSPDTMKTAYNVIVRGVFARGDVGTVLWGSRDLINWRIVTHSASQYLRQTAGTPYKYFRLAGVCDFDNTNSDAEAASKSIAGCTVEYEKKYQNKIR